VSQADLAATLPESGSGDWAGEGRENSETAARRARARVRMTHDTTVD